MKELLDEAVKILLLIAIATLLYGLAQFLYIGADILNIITGG